MWLDQGEIEHILEKVRAPPLVNPYRPTDSASSVDTAAAGAEVVLAILSVAGELFSP
jgi:Zn-finger nucleic acid-binding protein